MYLRESNIKLDTGLGGPGLFELTMTALSTTLTDKVEAGRACNAYVLSNLLVDKYSPQFEKDDGQQADKSLVKGIVKK